MAEIDENFWNEKHLVNDNWWLTGTSFNSLLNLHSLTSQDILRKKVLEIGVGLGTCTKDFFNLTTELYCCDISNIALDKVKNISKAQFLTKDLKSIPQVDIAFCHLVFQHCTDHEVKRIINDVNLSDHGIFSFQFAALKDGIITSNIQELINSGALFFRNLEKIKEIVNQTNKEIFYISEPKWWGGKNKHEWYFIKVRNKK